MSNWYQKSKNPLLPFKVVVYDNYGKGVHTPEKFRNRSVDASNEGQAFVKAMKTWPSHLTMLLNEYRQMGITVRFVPDEQERLRRDSIAKDKEDQIKDAWWNND